MDDRPITISKLNHEACEQFNVDEEVADGMSANEDQRSTIKQQGRVMTSCTSCTTLPRLTKIVDTIIVIRKTDMVKQYSIRSHPSTISNVNYSKRRIDHSYFAIVTARWYTAQTKSTYRRGQHRSHCFVEVNTNAKSYPLRQ